MANIASNKRSAKTSKLKRSTKLALLALLAATVMGQEASDQPVAMSSEKQFNPETGELEVKKINFDPLLKAAHIDDIEPDAGPTFGDTRVIVHGGPFTQQIQDQYPKPMCKFGHDDMIVPGTYIFCKSEKFKIEQHEGRHKDKNDTCIACDNSPPSAKPESISFTISLSGDFSDTQNSLPYRYYLNPTVHAIYPRYGPKDGDTVVQVWGEGFMNFDQDTRCSFGSKTVIATYVNSNYMICVSPFSDVVQKPISFTVLLNNQQNSKGNLNFWYYSWPSIVSLVPNAGPDQGGTEVIVKGNNFNPFKEEPIDNHNDTFIMFEGLGKVPVEVFNSTRARVYAPPSYILRQSIVEITLNNQQYTDDNIIYYYYRPPNLFDITPREGPVGGGTRVIAVGSNFRDTGNITCKFDHAVVPGKFLSESQLECFSPPKEKPGYVPLSVSLEQGMYSPPVQYLYYDKPVIYSIGPICGPDYGYTQITVYGKNFLDMGHNKVMCVFNSTIFTNATIMDSETIKCDSPAFLDKFGHSLIRTGSEFYNVEVTIDGGHQIEGPYQKFMYYRDPDILVISPPRGPISGGTKVRVDGKGFNQEGACNKTVRFATMETKPINETEDTRLYITAPGTPMVKHPDQVVVSVALNGQQFAHDKILHIRDDENTYEYYEDPIISNFGPKRGPNIGGTPIRVNGLGFTPLKDKNGDVDKERNKMWVRFVDPDNNDSEIAPASQVKPEELADDHFLWRTPPSAGHEKALMQISLNGQDWIPVPAADDPYSFTYYDAPHITKLSPSFGPVKDKRNRTMEIEGYNFYCPNLSCKEHLYVRFGEPPNQQILVKGEWISEKLVKCKIPKYTKPDVLRVELTLNGEDFTNDQKTYGYFDPYVLDAIPRLVSIEGTTKVLIKGFGFVNSGNTLAKYDSEKEHLVTDSKKDCIKDATFIDKNTLETTTYAQSVVMYEKSWSNIMFNAMTIEASVYENDFTENGIEVYYYQDPIYGKPSIDESPANVENQVFIPTDFKNQNTDLLDKYGNLTCRFQAEDGRVLYTKARMVRYPLEPLSAGQKPNSIQCHTPKWDLKGKDNEKVKLDISLNGQQFKGDFDFTFTTILIIHRTVPMAGPVQGDAKTRIIGQGFKPSKSHVDLKWGVVETGVIQKEEVVDYVYQKYQFENMVEGSEEIKAYVYEAANFARVDTTMVEERSYHAVYMQSTKLSWWTKTHGGPYYVEVGNDIRIEVAASMKGVELTGFNGNENITAISSGNLTDGSNSTSVPVRAGADSKNYWTFYEYDPSSVEYYYYKDCITKEVGPHSALTSGGTPVSVVGAWYKYMPEYGVVPHCRFGNKIVRAYFDSTVRIVCIAPPAPLTDENSDNSFWVSLNGVDFIDTGFSFSYYEQPIIYDVTPDSGPETGDTQIYISGANFTNMSSAVEFNCRFTPMNIPVPPKTTPATFLNSSMVTCPSPGGWGQGDSMHIQLTFNGADYDNYNFTFTFYSITRAFPRSGPSDGNGGDIVIEGYGFRNDSQPLCMINNTIYLAREVAWNYIKCPMPPANPGPQFFGNVNLKVSPNGGTRSEDWHDFLGGFQYYEQPIVEDIFPKQGPNIGTGVINFYGEGFRDDYALAALGCRVGARIGKAVFVSSRQIKCVIEELDLIDEGESSPAQVALNSYSWSKVLPSTQFQPYGILSLYPNSGPNSGVTDVIVEGKGFMYVDHQTSADFSDEEMDNYQRLDENEDLITSISNDASNARCRFGTPGNYAIVDAQILSYERLVCKAPQDFQLKDKEKFPLDVPFGIAFSNDEYDPWTETSHKFRFYDQPIITRSDPIEVEVGTISEVLVFADEATEFFDPVMINKPVSVGFEGNAPLSVGGVGGIMCRFGRFGETQGIYINETVVKCVTPAVEDDPDSIFRETIRLTVAMNGQDHDEETSQADFTFVGTGTYLVFWPFIIGALLIGLLIVALVVCCSAIFQKLSMSDYMPSEPHTTAVGPGLSFPKGRADWNKERSSVNMLERASGQEFYLRNQL